MKLKKIGVRILFVSFLLGFAYSLLLPCVAQAQELPPDMERIKERGKIIIAIVDDVVPPFFYLDDKGKLTGLDPELARDIASRMGVKVEFNRSSQTWDGVVELVVESQAQNEQRGE